MRLPKESTEGKYRKQLKKGSWGVSAFREELEKETNKENT